jgi:hypothetical protein
MGHVGFWFKRKVLINSNITKISEAERIEQ